MSNPVSFIKKSRGLFTASLFAFLFSAPNRIMSHLTTLMGGIYHLSCSQSPGCDDDFWFAFWRSSHTFHLYMARTGPKNIVSLKYKSTSLNLICCIHPFKMSPSSTNPKSQNDVCSTKQYHDERSTDKDKDNIHWTSWQARRLYNYTKQSRT